MRRNASDGSEADKGVVWDEWQLCRPLPVRTANAAIGGSIHRRQCGE